MRIAVNKLPQFHYKFIKSSKMLHDILIVFSKCKLMYLMISYGFNHIIRPWQAGHPWL